MRILLNVERWPDWEVEHITSKSEPWEIEASRTIDGILVKRFEKALAEYNKAGMALEEAYKKAVK